MVEPVNGLRGFDFEVVTAAFERAGRQVRIDFTPWKRAMAEVEAGTAAGILSCAYRAQREDFVFYSDQISTSTDGVFHRSDFPAKEITSAYDLIGENVGAVPGYATHSRLLDIGAKPFGVPDDLSGIRMLEVGRFDYLYNGRQVTDFLIKQLGFGDRFRFAPLEDKPFFLCISKAYPAADRLLADFNEGLAAVRADGTYGRIHAKYR